MHNVAVVYPLAFLVRRVLYSVALVFLFAAPVFAVLALLGLTLAMLGLVLTESPWTSRLVGWQHVANEVVLYVCLVLLFFCCGPELSAEQTLALGWTLVGLIAALWLFNSVVFVLAGLSYLRLVAKRLHSLYRRAKLAKAKS